MNKEYILQKSHSSIRNFKLYSRKSLKKIKSHKNIIAYKIKLIDKATNLAFFFRE